VGLICDLKRIKEKSGIGKKIIYAPLATYEISIE
jgi:hypothetical protein